MKTLSPQCQQLLNYLQGQDGWVTPLTIVRDTGLVSYRQRVSELRAAGYHIECREGERLRRARRTYYRLNPQQPQSPPAAR